MSDKNAQMRLFDAISNLEYSVNQVIKEKDDALRRVDELLQINDALKEEISSLKEANNILTQEIQQLSSKNPMQELILDSSSSCDVDLSISQLKSFLSRKN